MNESLVFDMSGDEKGAAAAFKRLIKENENLKRSMAESVKESERAEKAGVAFGKNMLSSIGDATASMLTLQSVLRAVNQEYEDVLSRQQKAAKRVTGTADAMLAFSRNLGDVAPEEEAWWKRQIISTTRRTSQMPEAVAIAMGNAISAQGNLTNEQVAKNVETAFRASPADANEAQAIAGGLADMASLTGSGDSMVNLGMMMRAGKQARVQDLRMVAQNLVPGAIGAKGFGGTDAEAMALVTTLTNLSKDTTGATSKTAAIAFSEQADKILGEQGSPLEHIRAMQEDPRLAKKFLDKASLPMEYKVPIQQLITKGSAADQLLTSNLAGYGTQEEMRQSSERYLARREADPLQRIAANDRRLASEAALMQLGDLEGAATGSLRSRVEEVLASSKQGYLSRGVSARSFDFQTMVMGRSAEEAAQTVLTTRYQYLNDIAGMKQARGIPVSDEDKEILKALYAMIKELEALRRDNANANAQKKNVDANIE